MLFPKQRIKNLFGIIPSLFLVLGLALTSLALTTDVQASDRQDGAYEQTNLVLDMPMPRATANFIDPNLKNPWGIAFGPKTFLRVADNAAGLSTQYESNGKPVPPEVTIPLPSGGPGGAATGTVFNKTDDDFVISKSHGKSRPATFIFATEDGTISGWNPDVDPTNAILVVDRSDTGAVYKGLASGRNEGRDLLFATNFHAGKVEVFNTKFKLVHSFTDPDIPAGFAPFGIQNIGGLLYVTFAKQDNEKHDDVAGPGNGFVDVFNTYP